MQGGVRRAERGACRPRNRCTGVAASDTSSVSLSGRVRALALSSRARWLMSCFPTSNLTFRLPNLLPRLTVYAFRKDWALQWGIAFRLGF